MVEGGRGVPDLAAFFVGPAFECVFLRAHAGTLPAVTPMATVSGT